MENNENLELCKRCGGKCCKTLGCYLSPSKDFKEVTLDTIREKIGTGIVSIDAWEGDARKDKDELRRTYFLRMRNKDAEIIDFSYGGECIALTETGCSLSFDDRPYGGKMLIPDQDTRCTDDKYSREDCATEWIPYQSLIEDMIDEIYYLGGSYGITDSRLVPRDLAKTTAIYTKY